MLVTRPAKGGYKVLDRLDMDQAKLEELPDSSDSFPIALSQTGRRYVFGIPTLLEKVNYIIIIFLNNYIFNYFDFYI
jgi:hypothetical protein